MKTNDFDNTAAQDKKTLSALLVRPNAYPEKVDIGTGLHDLQQAVGGTIEAVYPYKDSVALIVNDEGKLNGMPLNRALRDEQGQIYDTIAGNFLVVGLGEEDFDSLPPNLMDKYEEMFHQPELFIQLGSKMVVLPMPEQMMETGSESPEIENGER